MGCNTCSVSVVAVAQLAVFVRLTGKEQRDRYQGTPLRLDMTTAQPLSPKYPNWVSGPVPWAEPEIALGCTAEASDAVDPGSCADFDPGSRIPHKAVSACASLLLW